MAGAVGRILGDLLYSITMLSPLSLLLSFLLPSFCSVLSSPILIPSSLLTHAHTQHSSMSHSDVVRSCHKLPDSSSLDTERKLQRIATQGGMLFSSLECNVL